MIAHTMPFLMSLIGLAAPAGDVERFPPPDFDGGHILPSTQIPLPRAELWNYLDVAVLFLALSLASYLVIKKRSRRGIFMLTIFSLVYFGFIRQGCICSIGAIQNITLALFDQTYAIPFAAAAFFLLPLLFSLFFGRVFCSGVCPLGAIQDLVLIKPVKIPRWLQHSLGLLPYLYLGAAVLFAAMGSVFIICKYDPFVAFFRLSGNANIIVLSISMLVISMFVGRPYCLFLCPYSVLLRFLSRFSQWRVTVAPDECLKCRLCEAACPFGAITDPTPEDMRPPDTTDRRRLAGLLLSAPLIIILCGWIFSYAGDPFSRMHFTVRLAERIVLEDSGKVDLISDASKAFRDTGKSKEILFEEAKILRRQFSFAGWLLGCFMGLVIIGKLIGLSVFRKRIDYEADRAGCLACGRCFVYCPLEPERLHECQYAQVDRVLEEK